MLLENSSNGVYDRLCSPFFSHPNRQRFDETLCWFIYAAHKNRRDDPANRLSNGDGTYSTTSILEWGNWGVWEPVYYVRKYLPVAILLMSVVKASSNPPSVCVEEMRSIYLMCPDVTPDPSPATALGKCIVHFSTSAFLNSSGDSGSSSLFLTILNGAPVCGMACGSFQRSAFLTSFEGCWMP